MPTNVPADFNLQNWATIAVAAEIWNKSGVKGFFNCNDLIAINKLTREMVKKNEKAFHCLPRKIENQILCTFKSMGIRIALWFHYAQYEIRIPKYEAANVEWTVYGTVDERKILRNWLDSKMIQLEDSKQTQAVYYAACSNVCIDYIKLHWEEMLEFCNGYKIYPRSQPEIENKYIICSVIFLAKLESSQLLEAQIRYFNDFNYKEKRNMFMLSVEKGCPQAARYYWSQLSAADKEDLLIRAALLSLDCYRGRTDTDYFVTMFSYNVVNESGYFSVFECHKSNCFADLLAFFITHMSEDEISELFEYLNQRLETGIKYSMDALFDVLIYHWPLEEFLSLTYDVALKSCEKPTDYTKLVRRLLRAMDWNKRLGLCNKQYFHQKLFKALWNKLRKHNTFEEILRKHNTFEEILRKHNTFEEILSFDGPFLHSIYELFDLEVLKFIIDTCEDNYRKTIITYGETTFKHLAENGKFELLQKFMDDVLQFQDEREWFEKRIRNPELAISQYEKLPQENQTELADLNSELTFDSDEEKQNYSKNVPKKILKVASKKTYFVCCILL